jgi:hypothetical protein
MHFSLSASHFVSCSRDPISGRQAASGKKRTPQHEGVTEEGEETAENPFPPIQCATHPIGHPQGSLLSNTLYFSNAENASATIFWWFFPQASARALADMWIKMAGFPDLALRRCCLG